MNTSPTIALLAEALCAAQAEMEAAKKDSDNPFFKSKYADLASVWDAARGPLGRHGLAVIQTPETMIDVPGVVITTMLVHSSGEWVVSQLRLVPKVEDPQGIGSAVTYGRRYALAAVLGIAAEIDDDGNAASGKSGKPDTVTEAAKVFSRPKAAAAVAPPPAAPPAPPAATAASNAVPEAVEFIDRGMQVNFATIFRESLAPAFRSEAEVLRHEWLAKQGYIDPDGNPSSKQIPKKDYVNVRQLAAQWAREYSDGQVSAL